VHLAVHADFDGCFFLVAHVHGRRRIVACEDDVKPRRTPVFGAERLHAARHFGAHRVCDCLTVDDRRHIRRRP